MKTTFLICHLFGIIFLMSRNSCQPEYRNNARIFVEGKIISPNEAGVPVNLHSGNILISETNSKSDGIFKLGGAATTGEKSLSFGRKIKSFATNVADCKLDYDSSAIILPVNHSYFNFTQITLAP